MNQVLQVIDRHRKVAINIFNKGNKTERQLADFIFHTDAINNLSRIFSLGATGMPSSG